MKVQASLDEIDAKREHFVNKMAMLGIVTLDDLMKFINPTIPIATISHTDVSLTSCSHPSCCKPLRIMKIKMKIAPMRQKPHFASPGTF